MNISAIIVLYKPNLLTLMRTLSSITMQVTHCIVVNNGSDSFDFSDYSNIIYIELGDNYGIAHAQNEGIKKAFELKSDYILLSDQDTVYPRNYIQDIFSYSKSFQYDVLCPIFFDNVKQEYSPVMLTKFSYMKRIKKPIYVEHAIASGTIIKTAIFSVIGLMDDKLFIDYVDFEWCWRLKQQNMKILCVPNVVINHALGDGSKRIMGVNVTVRSNVRYYYMIRNGCYLALFCPNLKYHEKILLLKKNFRLSIAVFLLRRNRKTFFLILEAWFCGIFKKLT